MTRQEFIAKQQAYKQISGKGAVIAVALVLAFSFFVVGVLVLISFIRDHLKTAWAANSVTAIIAFVLFFFVLFCFGHLVRYFTAKRLKFGLICTGCGSPLVDAVSQADMAKGICRKCGKGFLEDA
jgi:uncharacterized membrane protein (DUF485 family)